MPATVLPDAGPIVPNEESIDLSNPVVAAGYKYEPLWVGRDDGWKGGSFEDAASVCTSINGQLCPFEAYCPLGGKHPIFPGFPDTFEIEEEHYSPIAGYDYLWVNVGMRNRDPSTTCLGFDQMYDNKPQWGLSSANPEFKRYILCCMKDGNA